MRKYLITGFSGFVSQFFLEYLENCNEKVVVLGVDLMSPRFGLNDFRNIECMYEKTDLLDQNQVDNLLYQFQPDYILHLASFSSVAFSWRDPVASYRNNTNIFLNILEQVRKLKLQCRILSVGSSEEYGIVSDDEIPLREDRVLKPISPYAVARVSQEYLSRVYIDGFGLDIIMTRSFNHIGPRQRDVFAVSSFARQVAGISNRGEREGIIRSGNVNIIRDFLDVRDVVRAYYMLLLDGARGEIYNICSGVGTSIHDLVKILADIAGVEVKMTVDDDLIRPIDNPIIIGSNEKIKKGIGWEPEIGLRTSLEDILRYWIQEIS